MITAPLVITAIAGILLLPATARANQPPTAVAFAGVDINTGQVLNQVILYIGPTESGIAFTVSGAGSSDPDGDPLTYRWECRDANGNKCFFALAVPTNQVNFRPVFPEGTWDITLTVNDGNFHTSTDIVRVKVVVDRTPPVVTPPDNTTLSATQADGARGADSTELHAFLFNSATATDDSTTVFTHLPPQVNGVDVDDSTVFPLGSTAVTFRIADNFGNVGAATSEVTIIDLQPGDLFVGSGVDIGFGSTAGLIYRIRNGQVSTFCESPRNGADPDYWPVPAYITVDSKGRVAAMAHLPFPNSFKFLRCHKAGQRAEKLGTFFGGYADPAWPQPFPNRNLDRIKGLHLQRSKRIVIDDAVNDGTPTMVNEEKYVFVGGLEGTPNASDRHSYSLGTDSLVWVEDELAPVGVSAGDQLIPEMYFHSKMESVTLPIAGGLNVPAPVASTYLAGGAMVRRVFRPLELEVSGSTPFGSFHAGLQAFGGKMELFNVLANDVNRPQEDTGCPPVGQVRTVWTAGGRITFDQFLNVTFEKHSGLVLKSNHGGLPAWMGKVSEALLNHDAMDDQPNMVTNPFNNCATEPIVDYESLTPGYHIDPLTGEGMDPTRTAVSVDGIYATQPQNRRVVRLNPGFGLSEVATNLDRLNGIGAFPPQVGTVHYTTVIIRIDSPVETLVSDSHGNRLGAVAGQSINDFGQWGFDSGPQSHPRFYVINYPQPGSYSVQSVGTGDGPFTVHVYAVNTTKGVSQHLSSSGQASPGMTTRQDFTLEVDGSVKFVNQAPVAQAGPDQTVDATGPAGAQVTLDGSLSSDPDRDALSFIWSGPFGQATGAAIAVSLQPGTHVLTLSVNDGKGGFAEDRLVVTVNATANVAPRADAGLDRTVRLGSLVTLDGGGSSDPDAGPGPLTFTWTQTGGPSITLSGFSTATPTFTPQAADTYSFELVVADGASNSAADRVVFTVPMLGDIDLDGDVDRDDLRIVTAHNGSMADGPNDLKDVNGDGSINVADARRLSLLCTRPQCAVQ